MPTRLILDTSALILLAKASLAELLPRLAEAIAVPAEVEREARATTADAAVSLLDSAEWIEHLSPISPPVHPVLGVGELAVLGWAQRRTGWVAVLDDLAARQEAGRLRVPFTGCVGLVQRAKVERLIPVVRPSIDALRAAGLYMSNRFYQQVIRQSGE